MSIFLHVSGRLGNQLFQWAYSYQIHRKYGSKVIPALDVFHHQIKSFSKEESGFIQSAHIEPIKRKNKLGLLLKILDKLSTSVSSQFLCKTFRIHRSLNSFELPSLPRRKPWAITGFFINSGVLEGSEEVIFAELSKRLEQVLPIESLPMAYQAVHVRRGDFAESETSYGLIDLTFYSQNIAESLPIVLCTESSAECYEIIEALRPVLVLDSKNSTPWQAIKVLSGAQHVVLSNSTLSWWAGFVAAKKGAKVIIPSPFYIDFEDRQNSLELNLFSSAPAIFKPSL